ncbi:MAG TPA: nitrogenase component 1 [Methylomusa anaerophila]|uniref:Nitrogenase iron-iron protein beta chain n=1 Tax=Methylomusa anaerophila TaxID=1930071 RepID=A0A348AFG3_9FIRM|nr:nitrogenase component 1 [Methylomusa anaerophila]BBB89811.1 nitrogenase iron-iron protein beta chain [Methylomusa anaerophila]HML89143.1 nitrogenase component 1 [Methylomusa anaerophila]
MYDELTFENCQHSKDPVLSCALEGVAGIIAGIRDVSMVIHSPQGCAATVAMAYDHHEIDFTRRKIGCSRLFEADIIMGASGKLKALIKEADQSFKTKSMFVIGTCAADIIGEDLNGLCRNLQPEISAKLIPVMAGGFRGDSYAGANLGLEALLPFIAANPSRTANTVNIIAPQINLNPTWRADLAWVKTVLNCMGITVQTVVAHDITLSELENAGTAAANILLSHDVGHTFARKIQERHGIPLILADMPLPVGLKNTARWLQALGAYFNAEDAAAALIRTGEELVIDTLRRRALMIIPRYRNCKIAVVADATIGIGLVRMLYEELEMIPELLLIKSDSPYVRKLLGQELNALGIRPKVVFGADGYQIKQALATVEVDAVLGSAWEKYVAEELGIRTAFDVLAPANTDIYLDRAYFGYEGMLNLLERVGNCWEAAFRSKTINWAQYERAFNQQ